MPHIYLTPLLESLKFNRRPSVYQIIYGISDNYQGTARPLLIVSEPYERKETSILHTKQSV